MLGKVLSVHTIPSEDDITLLLLYDIATNFPLPYTIPFHDAVDGNVLCVQLNPLFEDVAAKLEF